MKQIFSNCIKHSFVKFLIVFFILSLVQYFIFYNHYMKDYAFPWDFLETYFAVPYYWIELLRMNIDPSWIAQQGIGYPLYMNLQSGYFYPLNWIFVIFDFPYTLHNAVLLNIFHIFLGSLGIIYLTRMLKMNWTKSLLAALLYLTFGSFYGNSGHIDFIKAYAFTPWLIAPFIVIWDLKSKLFLSSIIILPFIIYCFWTGGYIGIVLATFFTLFLLLFIRFFFEKQNTSIFIYLFLSIIIGFLLSSNFLLPSFLDSSELVRSGANISYDYMLFKDFFALIYPIDNNGFSHDITMRSISIGFVGLSLFFISFYKISKINVYLLIILIISIFMATGILHKYVILFFPQLGLSRFPYSDYKGLIGISLILIAVNSLDYVKSIKLIYLFSGLVFITLFGNYYLNFSSSSGFNLFIIIYCILLTIFSLYIFKYKEKLGILLLLLTCTFDFLRIHQNGRYWNIADSSKYIESSHGISLSKNDILLNKIKSTENYRSERKDEVNHPYKYSGYFNGNYMMNDYGGSMQLKRHENIRNKEVLKSFALLKWTPINGNIDSINIENIQQVVNFVKLESYKPNEIKYSTNAIENISFIENEIYWKGWRGKLLDKNGNIIQEIFPENIDGFRKWNIPKGEYALVAYFTPPYKRIAMNSSIVGIFIWLIFIYYIRRKYSDDNTTRIQSIR